MPLRPGFKAAACRLACEVRAELGVPVFAPLDPYALAELYGIEVHDLSDPALPGEAVRHFTGPAAESFSGALLAVGTGSAIVENHAHRPARRRATVAHEMAHVLLEHDFRVLLTGDGRCAEAVEAEGPEGPGERSAGKAVEAEATELAGELLLPRDAARTAAFRGWTDTTVARYFRVSERMARWRMNVTAARRIARRTKAKRTVVSV